MRKIYFIIPLIIFITAGILYFLWQKDLIAVGQKAGLSVKSFTDTELEVFLDNEKLGATPFYSEELKPGSYSLTLSNPSNSYTTPIKLIKQTLTVVNWALIDEELFSMGEIVSLENSPKPQIAIISSPDKAKISLDGALIGVTPYLSQKVSEGKHKITVVKEGYSKRELNVNIPSGKKLNLKIKLSLLPLPSVIKTIESKEPNFALIKDLSMEKHELTANSNLWVKGVLFWIKKSDDEKNLKFDYFLDYQGKVFDGQGGDEISREKFAGLPKLKETQKITLGYLGNDLSGRLSEPAERTLSELKQVISPFVSKVKILATGTGWLRVRSGPSKSSPEIAKVNVGDELELLEEKAGWYKIKLADGREGWIKGSYVKRVYP